MDSWRPRQAERRLPFEDARHKEPDEAPPGLSPEQGRWSQPLAMDPLRLSPEGSGSPSHVWVQRLSLIIRVVFFVELGMLLAVLPWTRVWTENSILLAHPDFRAFMQQNFVRGAVTGLGVVDIWLGIWEAVHYREGRPQR